METPRKRTFPPLGKANFWDEAMEKYPAAVSYFLQWFNDNGFARHAYSNVLKEFDGYEISEPWLNAVKMAYDGEGREKGALKRDNLQDNSDTALRHAEHPFSKARLLRAFCSCPYGIQFGIFIQFIYEFNADNNHPFPFSFILYTELRHKAMLFLEKLEKFLAKPKEHEDDIHASIAEENEAFRSGFNSRFYEPNKANQ